MYTKLNVFNIFRSTIINFITITNYTTLEKKTHKEYINSPKKCTQITSFNIITTVNNQSNVISNSLLWKEMEGKDKWWHERQVKHYNHLIQWYTHHPIQTLRWDMLDFILYNLTINIHICIFLEYIHYIRSTTYGRKSH
jgi:hypothetical protein